MKTKCISVRLKSLVEISDMAFKAISFDGSVDIIPKSQVFAFDNDIQKSDAYWISEWILKKKDLQYSDKKIAWFNHSTGRIEPHITTIVEKHVPEKIENIDVLPIKKLER